MTYGIMNGPLRGDPHKEPKTISAEREEKLVNVARVDVNVLRDLFPEAREIDLLNAFLTVFSERTRE